MSDEKPFHLRGNFAPGFHGSWIPDEALGEHCRAESVDRAERCDPRGECA